MIKQFKNIAILVASGRGKRLGSETPKQFILVNQKAILQHTLEKFYNSSKVDAVLCVVNPDDIELYNNYIKPHPKLLTPVHGGNSRQESVQAGLFALRDIKPEIVLIHDAVRPNISEKMIDELIADCDNGHDAVCPALPMIDSLRKSDGTTIDRTDVYSIQTPQVFDYQKITKAHIDCQLTEITDDIAIAQLAGIKPFFIQGDESNFKITLPNDIQKFQKFLDNCDSYNKTTQQYPDIRTAIGYDVHRMIEGDGVVMGGIKIPCSFKLLGHSDADVVLHAITDALLGTIANQDIGYHFNPNDMRWKNADSIKFLIHAHELVVKQQGIINFIDTTIICEYPKISPYREAIRNNIAHHLNTPLNRISVKATTTEKLGFTGRGEGIAAQAIATVIFP